MVSFSVTGKDEADIKSMLRWCNNIRGKRRRKSVLIPYKGVSKNTEIVTHKGGIDTFK